jgi:hypothetical protein
MSLRFFTFGERPELERGKGPLLAPGPSSCAGPRSECLLRPPLRALFRVPALSRRRGSRRARCGGQQPAGRTRARLAAGARVGRGNGARNRCRGAADARERDPGDDPAGPAGRGPCEALSRAHAGGRRRIRIQGSRGPRAPLVEGAISAHAGGPIRGLDDGCGLAVRSAAPRPRTARGVRRPGVLRVDDDAGHDCSGRSGQGSRSP